MTAVRPPSFLSMEAIDQCMPVLMAEESREWGLQIEVREQLLTRWFRLLPYTEVP